MKKNNLGACASFIRFLELIIIHADSKNCMKYRKNAKSLIAEFLSVFYHYLTNTDLHLKYTPVKIFEF